MAIEYRFRLCARRSRASLSTGYRLRVFNPVLDGQMKPRRARWTSLALLAVLLAAPRLVRAQNCSRICPPAQRDPHGCCPARPVVVRPTRPTVASAGSVYVTANRDGATVLIDGRAAGVTPLRVDRLALGAHAIEVRATGHRTATRAVVVSANALVPVAVELQPDAAAPPTAGADPATAPAASELPDEISCARGDHAACVRAGYAYRDNAHGVRRDDARALRLYTAACEGGDLAGCDALGWMYANGLGTARDDARALQVYTRTCDARFALGCNGIAWMYENGHLGAPDRARAAEFYRRGCDLGLAQSCARLGQLSP